MVTPPLPQNAVRLSPAEFYLPIAFGAQVIEQWMDRILDRIEARQ